MTTITLPVSSLKSYLNRALIFINKSKLGIHPLHCCILFKDDKVYVSNGETGAIISFPMTVPEPTLVFPFDLARVVNSSKDEHEITLEFDYVSMWCKVTTPIIKTKIKLVDATTFTIPSVPDNLEKFEVEGFYQKVCRASFCAHVDASIAVMQGIKFTKESCVSTDQRGLWCEEALSPEEFLVTNLLKDHVEKLGLEPQQIALTDNGTGGGEIYLFYQDMVVFGSRFAEEAKYPNVTAVFAQKIRPLTGGVTIEYDRESLQERLEQLSLLPCPEGAIKIECKSNSLLIQNLITKADDTQADIELPVNSSADFDNVFINAELFKSGVERFISFDLHPKFLYFHKQSQEFCVMRRDVR
jgi:hypothetical protein